LATEIFAEHVLITNRKQLCRKRLSEASLCEELLLSESDFCFGVNR